MGVSKRMLPIRRWQTEHRIGAAIVAGFVATHITSVFGYWYSGITLPNLDFNGLNGLLLLPNEPPLVQFVFGAIAHYFTGICYALVFAALIHPLIPLPNSSGGNMIKALIWGAILALLSSIWWVPALFPQINAGVLLANLGVNWLAAVWLWHAVYAINLGLFYNPLPDDEPAASASSDAA